ncbi:recombinase family protein [Aquabacter sp. CN5-332]|uniref:recombinase family protein n=1 Tax=Aquabacter sp. CN5-332 TaxID=3156608 RepID=UPI0032B56A1E
MIFGCARVSTDDQSLEAQIEHLKAAGCEAVFSETASGTKTERRELRNCISKLKTGDILIVARLDRLARSTRDLLNVLAEVSDRGAAFRSISDSWGYHNATRPVDAHHPRRSGRVRAGTDSIPHR